MSNEICYTLSTPVLIHFWTTLLVSSDFKTTGNDTESVKKQYRKLNEIPDFESVRIFSCMHKKDAPRIPKEGGKYVKLDYYKAFKFAC